MKFVLKISQEYFDINLSRVFEMMGVWFVKDKKPLKKGVF